MLNALKIKRLGTGQEEISCVVNGKRAPKFIISPDARKTYQSQPELLSYIERSAVALLSMRDKGELRGRA